MPKAAQAVPRLRNAEMDGPTPVAGTVPLVKVRRRLCVTGRVQGVGFRDFVRRLATEMHLAGFVRNEPDGSVVAEIEGDAEAAQEFAAALSERVPRFARVEDVQIDDRTPTGESGFRITG